MCRPVSRPDFTIIAEDFAYDEASPGNIPWLAVVGSIELKRKRGKVKLGRLQFVETAWQVFRYQSERSAVHGMVVAGTHIQFLDPGW